MSNLKIYTYSEFFLIPPSTVEVTHRLPTRKAAVFYRVRQK